MFVQQKRIEFVSPALYTRNRKKPPKIRIFIRMKCRDRFLCFSALPPTSADIINIVLLTQWRDLQQIVDITSNLILDNNILYYNIKYTVNYNIVKR